MIRSIRELVVKNFLVIISEKYPPALPYAMDLWAASQRGQPFYMNWDYRLALCQVRKVDHVDMIVTPQMDYYLNTLITMMANFNTENCNFHEVFLKHISAATGDDNNTEHLPCSSSKAMRRETK